MGRVLAGCQPPPPPTARAGRVGCFSLSCFRAGDPCKHSHTSTHRAPRKTSHPHPPNTQAQTCKSSRLSFSLVINSSLKIGVCYVALNYPRCLVYLYSFFGCYLMLFCPWALAGQARVCRPPWQARRVTAAHTPKLPSSLGCRRRAAPIQVRMDAARSPLHVGTVMFADQRGHPRL